MAHRWGLLLFLFLFVSMTAVGCSPAIDPGPPPPVDHAERIRELQERLFAEKYELAGPSSYRFSAPVPDSIPKWHWEPQGDGVTHSFGTRDGWRIDYVVRPDYEGYPQQPESRRMAFYADGGLRGLFAEGLGNAPLALDRWSAVWVGPDWVPAGEAAPGR